MTGSRHVIVATIALKKMNLWSQQHEKYFNSDRYLQRRFNRNFNGHDCMEPKLNPQPDLNTCNPLTEYKPMPKMDTTKPLNGLVYCDYIAALIKDLLVKQSGMAVGKIEFDLHPNDGYLMSHKKILTVDYMGRNYKITLEDV